LLQDDKRLSVQKGAHLKMSPIEVKLKTSSDGRRWDSIKLVHCRNGESRDVVGIKGGMLRVVASKDGSGGELTLITGTGKEMRVVSRGPTGELINDEPKRPGEIKEQIERESSVNIVGPNFDLRLRHS